MKKGMCSHLLIPRGQVVKTRVTLSSDLGTTCESRVKDVRLQNGVNILPLSAPPVQASLTHRLVTCLAKTVGLWERGSPIEQRARPASLKYIWIMQQLKVTFAGGRFCVNESSIIHNVRGVPSTIEGKLAFSPLTQSTTERETFTIL